MSSDSDSFGPPYLVKGQLWYFETVQTKLGADNMEYLCRSCLGHLFQIANITLQAPLLVVMLKNLEGTSLKRRTLSFRFNSRSIEFNREDFSLMTGLKYGTLTPLTRQQSEIHSTLFSSQRTIKFQDIHTAFFKTSTRCKFRNLLLYNRGSYPRVGGVAWEDVDFVYGIGHVLGNHWVAYECNFVEQIIVIYDPMSETGWKNDVVDEFTSVARAVPAMIMMGDVWTKKGWKEATLKTEWNIIYNKRNPQQSNDTDCGIMAMKFIECLVSANSVDVINPERCGFFRKVYCSQLYNARIIAKSD